MKARTRRLGMAAAGAGAWFANNFEANPGPFPPVWTGLTLTSPVVAILNTGQVTIRFDHRFDLEGSFDGCQLQVSLNGGAFTTVTNASFTSNGYNGTIQGYNPDLSLLAGQDAWTGTSAGYATPTYITSVAGFSLTAGDSLQFRFLGVWDTAQAPSSPGWVIDNVLVQDDAAAVVPEPSTLISGGLAGLVGLGLAWRRRKAKASA